RRGGGEGGGGEGGGGVEQFAADPPGQSDRRDAGERRDGGQIAEGAVAGERAEDRRRADPRPAQRTRKEPHVAIVEERLYQVRVLADAAAEQRLREVEIGRLVGR